MEERYAGCRRFCVKVRGYEGRVVSEKCLV